MGKFGWHYPPGAANDPNAPWNQPDPPECNECGGFYAFSSNGHERLPIRHGQICYDCDEFFEEFEEFLEICPNCDSDDIGGVPCPNDGMEATDYEESQRAAAAEDRYDAMKDDGLL